jgi:hypothetical protein
MCSCGEAEQDTSYILQTIQEPSGIGIRDLANTNNTPGEALFLGIYVERNYVTEW